jgi:hypothetical protein
MKRVINWVIEERITLTVLLMGIGIILGTLPHYIMFGGMLLYASVILLMLSATHKLYLKFKNK